MKRLFDSEVIRAQITNLEADRDRISRAIESLQSALRSIEKLDAPDPELPFDQRVTETTLHDAVRRCCMTMVDGITRQRVITAIEHKYPGLRPKSASVAASLVNLTKGYEPALRVAIEGRGRRPALYSSEGNIALQLSSDEVAELLDSGATRGTGGWQSLWAALLKEFDKASGMITLSPELRARIFHYLSAYGHGGWQNKVKRIFRRHLPHLFVVNS